MESREIPTATERRSCACRGGASGGSPARTLRARVWDGDQYDPDDLEALVAVDRYKRERHRPHPHLTELLDVLRGLGWEKRRQT